MNNIVLIILAILPTIAFIVGFSFGFNIKKEDKVPNINPVEIVKEIKEKKKEEKESKVQALYLENIDNFPDNQKVIKE